MNSLDDATTWTEFVGAFKLELCLLAYALCCLGKVVFGVLFVLPQFKSIFASMNVELPALTSALLSLSDLLEQWWYIALPSMAVALGCAVLYLLVWLKARGMGPKGTVVRAYAFVALLGANLLLYVVEVVGHLAMYRPMLTLTNSVH